MAQTVSVERKSGASRSNEATSTETNSTLANAALWVVKIAVAYMFIQAGYAKLAGAEQMVGLFNAIGVGQWFRYATGIIEIAGAVMILLPSVAGFGAFLLAATMVGAIITHLFVIGGSPLMPVLLLAASLVILANHREQWLRFLSR